MLRGLSKYFVVRCKLLLVETCEHGVSIYNFCKACCMRPKGTLPGPMFMVVCSECGNKRCPKATDPKLACTHSNEPGQPGSRY